VRPPAAEAGRPQPNFAPAILSQVQYPVFLCQLINATCFCEMPFRRGLYSALGCRPSPHLHIGDSCVPGSEGGNSPDCFSLSRLAAPPRDGCPLSCGSFWQTCLPFRRGVLCDKAFHGNKSCIGKTRQQLIQCSCSVRCLPNRVCHAGASRPALSGTVCDSLPDSQLNPMRS